MKLLKLSCIPYELDGLFISDKRSLKHSLSLESESLLYNHRVSLINTKNSFRYPVRDLVVNEGDVSFDIVASDNDLAAINAIELDADIDYQTHQNFWDNSATIDGVYTMNKPGDNLYYGWDCLTTNLGLKLNDTLTLSYKFKLIDGVVNRLGLYCSGMTATSFYLDGINVFESSTIGTYVYITTLEADKEIDVQVSLRVDDVSALTKISIQPNRGLVDIYSAQIYQVQLEKGLVRTPFKLSLKEAMPLVKSVSLRLMVPQYYVKTESKPVEFLSGNVEVRQTNMLYPRLRLGFPSWSAVYKNSTTNASKLLEPILTPMYEAYSKLVEYSSRSMNEKLYLYKTHSSVYKPKEVYKVTKDTLIPLVQGNLQTMPKLLNVGNDVLDVEFSRLFLAPRERLDAYDMKPFQDVYLYFRLLDNSANSTSITIKGLDKAGRYLQETLVVYPLFYTTTNKVYNTIIEIVSESEVVLSNYLDCKYDNYLAQGGSFKPAIVNNDFRTFHPYASITRNEEDTRDVLCIAESRMKLQEHVYTFNTETDKIDSVFITKHLDIFWKAGDSLYSGVINHDLTKIIGHTSNNANDMIYVTNTTTSIGDWIEAKLNLQKWGNKPMVVQIKNKDTTLYYDQTSETFVDKMVYLYPDTSEDLLEISVKVTNEDPYIFSMYDDTFSNVYVASSSAHVIHSVQKTKALGDLYHYNNELVLVDNFGKEEITHSSSMDTLLITIIPEQSKDYDWSLNINGHILSPNRTTMSSDLYNVKSLYGEDNLPVVFELFRGKILSTFNTDNINFTLNISSNDQYTFNSQTFKLYLSDAQNDIQRDISVGDTVITLNSNKEISIANKT